MEFDPRREAQQQEVQELLRSNPSWKVPLPHTHQRASSSHEEIVASSSDEDIVDASIGFDNDKAEDFVDEVSKVPVEWDIQEEYISVNHQYGIEDDIPPEAPRVARRPPMDKKDVRDMGTDKEQTALWRRGKHAFEDVNGRYYVEGKRKSRRSSMTKGRFHQFSKAVRLQETQESRLTFALSQQKESCQCKCHIRPCICTCSWLKSSSTGEASLEHHG